MIRLKDLYGFKQRHQWRCVLCGAHGVGWTAAWAAQDFETHYAAKHQEAS